MPELPEVETTLRGISPHVTGSRITEIIVKRHDLRLPVSPTLIEIERAQILNIRRRSKYLLFSINDGSTLLIHLGMSGSLRIIPPGTEWKKHDHLGISLSNGKQLRFHDPRRFGLVIHFTGPPEEHPLLAHLGPEPLEDDFRATYLERALAGRKVAVKSAIMDAKVVVGVGNIYASESLFRAGILPHTQANLISRKRLERLCAAIKEVLADSIEQGGTTLRDFLNSDGEPGYFRQQLFVYERKEEPCLKCGTPIRHAVTGQRSTYWCTRCQR